MVSMKMKTNRQVPQKMGGAFQLPSPKGNETITFYCKFSVCLAKKSRNENGVKKIRKKY
jgi:hypothetical protein